MKYANQKEPKKKDPNKRIIVLLWFLQIIAEVLAVAVVWRLDMLPAKYFLVLAAALVLLALMTGALLLPSRRGTFRRGFGLFLSVVIFIGSCAVTILVADVHGTISKLTGKGTVQASVSVYVKTEDPAESINDAADYRFAIVEGYDTERTQEAIDSIEEKLNKQLDITAYSDVQAMLEDFFSGDIGALILNSAYTTVLEDLDGYEDFSDQVRALHEVEITVQNNSLWEQWKESFGGKVSETPKSGDITQDSFVVYISGSDTRNKKLVVGRSDVNILAIVNPKTKQVLLLNTPRDYYVANPAGNGAMDKLTHCGNFGIECSMEALANLYDVQVDYYAQINFTGFETLIDAIGGVTVYSDTAFSTVSGISFSKGENTLNGTQALAFARERKHLASGDNARGQNQMKVIKAVINKLTSGSTIISNYAGIMESLEGMFATSLSMSDISSLVKMQLADMAQWNILSYAVTGNGGSDITYSVPGQKLYVMYQDAALVSYASELIDRVIAGEILTEEDMTAPS